MRSLVLPLGLPVLRLAEQEDVVWNNGIPRREIGKPPRHPDFVTLINSRIALDRFHERAGLALLGRAALAETAAAQTRPQLVDRLGGPGEVVPGVIVGVEWQVDVDPFKLRHHAAQRADVLFVALDRRPRRHGAVAAAGHDQFGAALEFNRHRRPARIAQFLLTAGRALRPACDVVPGDARAQEIETDDVTVQLGAEIGSDCFGDLHGVAKRGVRCDPTLPLTSGDATTWRKLAGDPSKPP